MNRQQLENKTIREILYWAINNVHGFSQYDLLPSGRTIRNGRKAEIIDYLLGNSDPTANIEVVSIARVYFTGKDCGGRTPYIIALWKKGDQLVISSDGEELRDGDITVEDAQKFHTTIAEFRAALDAVEKLS